MLSESLGAKRGSRESPKEGKTIETWEPNPVFLGCVEMDWLSWYLPKPVMYYNS